MAKRTPGDLHSPYREPSGLRPGQILHLETGRVLTEPELLDYLSHFPVVYVGETHDSLEDHEAELAILRGLDQRLPGRLALGLEMLPRNTQPDLDAYLRGETEEGSFVKLWLKSWGHTFEDYRGILHYAREHGIRVLALNVEDDLKRALRSGPPERLDPAIRSRLPELDLEDPYYRALNQSIFEAHSMGSRDPEAFLRVQALWDETMAQTAAEFLRGQQGEGRHLVILAGGYHVKYGFGIPRRLFRRVPLPYAIVYPLAVEIAENKKDRLMDVKSPDLPIRPADFYWAVRYRGPDTPESKPAAAPDK